MRETTGLYKGAYWFVLILIWFPPGHSSSSFEQGTQGILARQPSFFLSVSCQTRNQQRSSKLHANEKNRGYPGIGANNTYRIGKVLFSDDFESDRGDWIVETREPDSVVFRDGTLELNVNKGCTVWFKEKLEGPVLIQFEIEAVDKGGPNDSVNDMNIFWMAKDLEHPENIFHPCHGRNGDFSDYHALRLYYVGHGKDYSTGIGRVRFRRYPGDGTRPLLPQHMLDDNDYLVSGNILRRVQVVAGDDIVQYISNGQLICDFRDPSPFTGGWFAFRTVRSHLILDNFRVYRLIREE